MTIKKTNTNIFEKGSLKLNSLADTASYMGRVSEMENTLSSIGGLE